jgi:hypothetical protein
LVALTKTSAKQFDFHNLEAATVKSTIVLKFAAALLVVCVLSSSASAQYVAARGYNPFTGRTSAMVGARNPFTGGSTRLGATNNPFTGNSTRSYQRTNPITGTTTTGGIAVNRYTGQYRYGVIRR